jgi:hypothetical protein
MGRTRKSKTSKNDLYAGYGDAADEAEEDADLPKDEAGRRKIKRQYHELLGIRIEKLRGRILNRERINKTIEGIYFICSACMKVCHSLDDGLLEDPENTRNLCANCAKVEAKAAKAKVAAAQPAPAAKERKEKRTPSRPRAKRKRVA